MEVHAALRPERQRLEEEVHEKRFATADAAPEVQPPGRRLAWPAAAEQPRQETASAGRRAIQFIVEALQVVRRFHLRRIESNLSAFDGIPVPCSRAFGLHLSLNTQVRRAGVCFETLLRRQDRRIAPQHDGAFR